MKKKISKSLGNLKSKVVTADKVPAPVDKTEWHTPSEKQMEEILHFNDVNNDIAERVKSFCKQFKTNPDDLFSWLMDNYEKKDKGLKSPKNEKLLDSAGKTSKFTSDWRKQLIKAKTGYSPTD